MKKRVHVIFHGRVQGVGFRFTAESVAQSLGAVGWVKNLTGGEVELVAEAEEKLLEDLIHRIDEYFASYITDKDINWEPAKEEFKGFGVRF